MTNEPFRKNTYATVVIDDSGAVDRCTYEAHERGDLESAMSAFRGVVYVDERDEGRLPLAVPEHAQTADLGLFRRAKTEDDKRSLGDMRAALERTLHADPTTFRGAASDLGYESTFRARECNGFTEYRGALRDEHCRVVESSNVVPHTEQWERRLRRVEDGFDAVERAMEVGGSVAEYEALFRGHLDPVEDRVFGNVVQSSGFEFDESVGPLETVQEHDTLRLCAVVQGDGETATLFLAWATSPASGRPRGTSSIAL